jgi:peptidoglycan/LPS O-acetylase OafA/YrhL
MNNGEGTRIYFPGLNGLRFVAALAVIITHVELLKFQTGLHHNWKNPLIFNLGGLGVYFFFVLSGFLISYLLMAEKTKTGTVSVRKFYVRRILRIWPLYYLIVLLGFFVFPYFDILKIDWLDRHFAASYWPALLLNLFMLPNLALAMFPAVPHIGQVWSIGVEEQFYLVWPLLVKFSTAILRVLLVILAVILVVKTIVLGMSIVFPGNRSLQVLRAFLAMSKIECMTIGSIGAYVLFTRRNRILKWIYAPATLLVSLFILPLLIYFTPDVLQDGIHLVYSVFFIVIILNVASNPVSFLKMENPLFNFLGNISYGLYMFHMVIVVFVIRSTRQFFDDPNSVPANICYYAGAIGLTILVSWLSFRYFESIFNRKRKKMAVVKSSSDPNEGANA